LWYVTEKPTEHQFKSAIIKMWYICKGMQTVRLCSRDIYFRTTKRVLWLARRPDNEDFSSRSRLPVDATELKFHNSTWGQAIFDVLSLVSPLISSLHHSSLLPNIT
jgi:hypothetical protein